MGEVKKSSSLGYSSSLYVVVVANKVDGMDFFIREIGDFLFFIVRRRRGREKNREECLELDFF